MGTITPDVPTLVRVHSECLTSDVFGSIRCDCGEQLALAQEAIAREGKGVFVYMRQEGRGIGIHNKLKAYDLQDDGLDTVDANVRLGFAPDIRHYGVGVQILEDLGVGKMRILTNNPRKLAGLDGFGKLKIVEQVPIKARPNKENSRYLETKRKRMGHLLDESDTINGSEG
jgi:3,4-dihydroxy 2-butanone 4-phosphate synthase/GTP cyclohydrolase II